MNMILHGVLFRGGAEGKIRCDLIEECNYLDAVIGLPANIFFGTELGIAAEAWSMIQQTRAAVACTGNAGLIVLYWRIGKHIHTEVFGNQRAEYGKEIVAALGRGFERRNLFHPGRPH